MSKMRRRCRATGMALFLACNAASGIGLIPIFDQQVRAGTIRHDRSDSLYTALGNDAKYASVGGLVWNGGAYTASAVLISPKFVLSAAHTTDTLGTRNFNLGGATISGATVSVDDQYHFANPAWTGDLYAGQDIGLLKLSSTVTSIMPATRFFYAIGDNSEVTALSALNAKLGTSVGFGQSGTGLTGAQMNDPVGPGQSPSGTKRAVQNDIDATGSALPGGFSDNIFWADFDSPLGGTNTFGSSSSGTLEGMVAPGDSGGGTFVDINGRTYLTGIHSFIGSNDGLTNASYHDLYAMTRVSQFNMWIDDNIVNYWNNSSSGSFDSASGWTLGTGSNAASFNPSTGDIAGFKTAGAYTLTLGASVDNHQLLARAGDVTLNLNGQTYTLTSTMYEGAMVVARYNGETASITFANGTVNSRDVLVAQMAGSNGRVTVGSGATMNVVGDAYVGGSFLGNGGNGTLTVANSNSTLNVSGKLRVLGSGRVNYNAGSLSVGTLDIANGGRVNLSTGGNKVLRSGWVSIASGGKLDLTDNDMIVTAQPITMIKTFISDGFANGAWNGSGIINSAPASDTRYGYGLASTLGVGSFDGISVTGSSVLVKYTYAGDANLDGKVDVTDLGNLALAWNGSGLWSSGDFNYDGLINVGDLQLLAANWLKGVSAPLGPTVSLSMALASFGVNLAAVPEPAAISLLGAAALLTLRRRRRT